MADKKMEAQISVEFEEATSRQSLNSGETINTLWSKVKRWLSDLKAVAFSGSYNDLSDKPTTATTDTDGLMSASDKTKLDNADNTYALKSKYGNNEINVGRKAETRVGVYSTAEGDSTTASGDCSHAEGHQTIASGFYSHAEGYNSVATVNYSHAEGYSSLAYGAYSHAGGLNTKALHDNEVSYGAYNESSDDTLFSIGDGTADDARHNAFEITTTGGKLHDKDIATTENISNPNLLINPDFSINQRDASGTIVPNKNADGENIHTYFVDRWGIDSGSVTINADGTLTLNGTISQILENASGTNVTASVSAGTASYDDSTKTFTITGNGVTISWAKLETGITPTPFSPPDPATELMKCKRYYQRISGAYRQIANGFIQSTNVVTSITPLPQELRITSSTINFVGKIYLWYKGHIGSGGVTSTQTASPPNVSQITLSMSFKLDTDVDASYIGMPCLVQFRDATSYIEINAEL